MIENLASSLIANWIFSRANELKNGRRLSEKDLERVEDLLAELQKRTEATDKSYEKEFGLLWDTIAEIEKIGPDRVKIEKWKIVGDTLVNLIQALSVLQSPQWNLSENTAVIEEQVSHIYSKSSQKSDVEIYDPNKDVQDISQDVENELKDRLQGIEQPQTIRYEPSPVGFLVQLFRMGTLVKRERQFLRAHLRELEIQANAAIKAAEIISERLKESYEYRLDVTKLIQDDLKNIINIIVDLVRSGEPAQIELADKMLKNVTKGSPKNNFRF